MPRKVKYKSAPNRKGQRSDRRDPSVRIIGGKFRGRVLAYHGDRRTRPMKDTTREAIFNLVGGYLQGKHCFDLFAGTGAVGLEAISRGCVSATFVERHIPTIKVLNENIRSLDVSKQVDLTTSDTFFWCREFFTAPHDFPSVPWAVFFCPPYQLFVDRKDELSALIGDFFRAAPEQSIFVVESDGRFPDSCLPDSELWDLRVYSPARVAVLNQEKLRAK